MAKKNIVLESVYMGCRAIASAIRAGGSVYMVEPFHAYHHRKGKRDFCPNPVSGPIKQLIDEGHIRVISAGDLCPEEIYFSSARQAVEDVEKVYPFYRQRHRRLIEYVSRTLGLQEAEHAFKSSLCNRIAGFYSLNTLIARVQKLLGDGETLFYSDIDVYAYGSMKKLLSAAGCPFLESPGVRFPLSACMRGTIEGLKKYIICFGRLCVQTALSGILGWKRFPLKTVNKTYAVTVIAPRRQLLEETHRKPDFIVDHDVIKKEEVVYIPLVPLSPEQKASLARLSGDVVYMPQPGQLFSHFTCWGKLLWTALGNSLSGNAEEVTISCNVFFRYFAWKTIMEKVHFKHLISHVDFGTNHVGRNIALKQAGVQTWYFMDSMNQMSNFCQSREGEVVHYPYWTYLYYDHLVLWSQYMAEYYLTHPGSCGRAHVVGCLWGSYVREKAEMDKKIDMKKFKISREDLGKCTILTAFDSSYTKNSFTSFEEGILFAEHLLRLVDECPEIYLLFKEKKERDAHMNFDSINGPKLVELYKRMDEHPRISVFASNEIDSSDLMSLSDAVVSFPFSSTTFEALSVKREGFWHDPMNRYGNTVYGRIDGVMTRSYDDMKNKVEAIIRSAPNGNEHSIPEGAYYMDPFRDGRALDRFRELLSGQRTGTRDGQKDHQELVSSGK